MNHIVTLLIVALSTGLVACGEETAYGAAFTNSHQAWLKAKATTDGSYIYETELSTFAGYGEITVITVEQDVVSKRRFASYEDLAFRDRQLEAWTEEADEVGSHLSGSAAVSLDTLYTRCQEEILTADPEENEIIFTVDQRGLLKTCVYVPRDCVDDCAEGVTISAIDLMTDR